MPGVPFVLVCTVSAHESSHLSISKPGSSKPSSICKIFGSSWQSSRLPLAIPFVENDMAADGAASGSGPMLKMMALLARCARMCQSAPWPLAAMKSDTRDATWAGPQDADGKARVDEKGAKGGGKRVKLVKRPVGEIKKSDFEVVTESVPEPEQGEVVIKHILISLDPTHRLWMSDQPQYMPCVGIGTVMRASAVGKVIKCPSGKFKEGAFVSCQGGVQEYSVCKEAMVNSIVPGTPLAANVSIFNPVIGLTAWVGINILEPRQGQTMVVSGAAGAVGCIAAQLAKARGMKVIGIAGGKQKVQWLKDELKLDDAIDYKGEGVAAGLARCCPNGVDAYFDNVGGETLETILTHMNRFGCIAYCGHISGYNSESAPVSVNQFQMILMRRIKIQGFICIDHVKELVPCFGELLDLYAQGKLKVQEDIQVTGLENYVDTVNMLFSSKNQGKLMMKIADA